MGMGTNNWVKDGLDAYLALTGEARAERKAEQDKAYQQQTMELARNADKRAADTATLQNEHITLDNAEKRRKADDLKKAPQALRGALYRLNELDGSFPNTPDPEQMASAREAAAKDATLAQQLDGLPDGFAQSISPETMPQEYKDFATRQGLYDAARRHAGSTFTEAKTNIPYTTTGELGPINILKQPDKEAVVQFTMWATKKDGQGNDVRFPVPFTKRGTNEPDDEVRFVTPSMLKTNAGSRLAILADAENSGRNPLDVKTDHDYQLMAGLSPEQQMEMAKHISTTIVDKKIKAGEEERHARIVQDVMLAVPADADVSTIARAMVDKGIPAKDAKDYVTSLAKAPKQSKAQIIKGVSKRGPMYEASYEYDPETKTSTYIKDSDTLKFDLRAHQGQGGGAKESQLEQKATFDQIKLREADYDKRRAEYNSKLAEASSMDDKERAYTELRVIEQVLADDRKTLEDQMALYNKKYGVTFAPRQSPATGMRPPAASQAPGMKAQAAPAQSPPTKTPVVMPARQAGKSIDLTQFLLK